MQLEPFAYHLAIADRLEQIEPDLWRWFQAEHIGERYRKVTLADLEERTIRLHRTGSDELRYVLAETACERLGITAPVSLFRLREDAAPGTILVFVPDAVLIAFSGNMLDLLEGDAELLAAIGRETARFQLYHACDGRIRIAACLLRWLTHQEGCTSEIAETSRRFGLMTEAYCDLGGLLASENRDAAVRVLFKGRPEARAEAQSYLQEADAPNIEARATSQTDLAARAMALIRAASTAAHPLPSNPADLVASPIELGSLDLLDQQTLHDLTRAVIDRVVAKTAGGTPAVLAHAREMFPDYTRTGKVTALSRPAIPLAASVIDYLAYLLLDLATVAGTRLRDAIAVSAAVADELDIGTRFREIARQELRGRRGLQAGLSRQVA